MANEDVHVVFDQHALSLWLLDVEEAILPRLAEEVAAEARTIAPVRVRRTAPSPGSKRSGAPGGKLKASVQYDIGHDFQGAYADIAGLWYGRFLDPRSRQLRRLYPFLPTALFNVLEGRDIYLD